MESAELHGLFGDPVYQAMIAEDSMRGVSDSDLEASGHKPYASDVDTDAEAAQLGADFIERLDGPLIPKFPVEN